MKTRHQRQYLPAIGTAKAVSCPVCGAAPGFRCVSRSLTRRLVVLEKKPTPDELPEPAFEIIKVLEEKGGSVEEAELEVALAKKVPPEHVTTLWDYWRGKLVDMGILAIKADEPKPFDENPDIVTPRL